MIKQKSNDLLCDVYGSVYTLSKRAMWQGRLLALPVAVMMMVSLPLVKLLVFIEDILLLLFGIKKAAPSVKEAALDLCGLIISPVVTLFVGIAVFLSLLNNHLKASGAFIQTCRGKRC